MRFVLRTEYRRAYSSHIRNRIHPMATKTEPSPKRRAKAPKTVRLNPFMEKKVDAMTLRTKAQFSSIVRFALNRLFSDAESDPKILEQLKAQA